MVIVVDVLEVEVVEVELVVVEEVVVEDVLDVDVVLEDVVVSEVDVVVDVEVVLELLDVDVVLEVDEVLDVLEVDDVDDVEVEDVDDVEVEDVVEVLHDVEVVDEVDVLVVGGGDAQAWRKWEPNTAHPLQNAALSTQVPISSVASTVSSTASFPPRVWVGALMRPKSGPSAPPSMSSVGSSMKPPGQATSAVSRLPTNARPHCDTGARHAGSPPVHPFAELVQ